MRDTQLRSIAIVGGGLAGWMAAATLSRLLKKDYCRIVLTERPQPAALGSAEGTIPAFQRFNNLLGIGEDDFMRATDATFKLGIRFKDWMRPGDSYFHTFCGFGGAIASVPFHHYWLKLRSLGDGTGIEDYSIATAAAKLGRFQRPVEDTRSPLSLFSHAYHFDGDLYVRQLRDYAMSRGVERIDRAAVGAGLRDSDGFIESIVLDDGRRIEADFFIDCTGFPGLLIEQTLKTGIEDWSRWLPCDRAASAARPSDGPLAPYTTATAHVAGWQWSMPLRSHADHGYIYSSAFAGDDEALRALPKGAEPKLVRFANGRPKKFWNRNCLSLPGGFLEPLESTNLHLIQTGILKLFGAFPDRTFNPADSDEYNRLTILEYERTRDFLILHYDTAQRGDTPFWRHCRDMDVPDTLRHRIELFRGSGRVNMLDNEHFAEQSWLSLFFGHGIFPRRYDPLADVPALADVRRHLQGMALTIEQAAQSMPTLDRYLGRLQQPTRGDGA